MIHAVGKGGNPHTMKTTPGMIVGVGTDVICGEGLICTAGGLDIGAFFTQSKDAFVSALCSGVTTIFGTKIYISSFFLHTNLVKKWEKYQDLSNTLVSRAKKGPADIWNMTFNSILIY
jgi:urease alpha subunit